MKAPRIPGPFFRFVTALSEKAAKGSWQAFFQMYDVRRYWLSTDTLVYGANPVLAALVAWRALQRGERVLVVINPGPDAWNYPLLLSGHYDDYLQAQGLGTGARLIDTLLQPDKLLKVCQAQLDYFSVKYRRANFSPVPSKTPLSSRAQRYYLNQFNARSRGAFIGEPSTQRPLIVRYKTLVLVSDFQDGCTVQSDAKHYEFATSAHVLRLGSARSCPRSEQAFVDQAQSDFDLLCRQESSLER